MAAPDQDSPLSVSANVAGILTFVVAIAATVYARLTYLRNSDDEYFRVKTSLLWYKTESTWLADLVTANNKEDGGYIAYRAEYQMHAFVMDDILKLEERLLDLVAETEAKATVDEEGGWTLVPRSWQGGRTTVAMAWLPVRAKALELVRQRESLTARVQFMQMSMISSRLRDLEMRTKGSEMRTEESSLKLQAMVENQKDRIRCLEDMMARLIHYDKHVPLASLSRVGTLTNLERTKPNELFEDDIATTLSEISSK